mgnify:FL=1|jgi:hypothetical protein
MTNREFATQDAQFRKACEVVGLEPTRRQASKWRSKQGLAYQSGRKNVSS